MSSAREARLPAVRYITFPFRMTAAGAAVSNRASHIREQIEQVLLTSPGERVFRFDFGFGARRMVFEPNASEMWQVAQNRLYASLAESLAGEVDPRTLKVDVTAPRGAPERLVVRISYVLAALQKEERHEVVL